jgi:hypothetical protein
MFAINLKNLQINQIENLLTKEEFYIKEFYILKKKFIIFKVIMNEFRNETKSDYAYRH